MKKSIAVVAALVAANVVSAQNLVKNSSLAANADGWKTVCMRTSVVDGKTVKNPDKEANFIGYVADDGAAGTKGCLKVAIKITDNLFKYPTHVGVFPVLSSTIKGSKESPARVKVSFYAKSLEPTPGCLHIGREIGGSNRRILALTAEWQKFEVELTSEFSVNHILFTPTNKKGNEVVADAVLLDEVSIEAINLPPVAAP